MAGEADFEVRLARLLEACEELSDFLAGLGVRHWADWFLEAEKLLRAGDVSGVEHARAAFGGMGSFNDLLISRLNGHLVGEGEEPAANARLIELRERVGAFASSLADRPRSSGGREG